MQTSPQVSFDDIPVDEAVRAAALEHAADLERFSDRLTGGHVVAALRDAFAAERRRLEDHVRRMRGDEKRHAGVAPDRSPPEEIE